MAIASPIPCPAPVMIATLPARRVPFSPISILPNRRLFVSLVAPRVEVVNEIRARRALGGRFDEVRHHNQSQNDRSELVRSLRKAVQLSQRDGGSRLRSRLVRASPVL